jgi:hypothetical protein
MKQEDFERFHKMAHVAVPAIDLDGKPYTFSQFNLKRFAELIWEEAYEAGSEAGYEEAILKERG